MTRRHALESPGLFGNVTLRCGRSGDVISTRTRGFAIMTERRWLYYIADASNPVTCSQCLNGHQFSDEHRKKLSVAKQGNKNASGPHQYRLYGRDDGR